MRLIDADEFIKDECNNCDGACESLNCDCLECKADCRCDFIKDIESAPTIDAVPVVRCKDCKLWWQCSTEPNWFCADGERKDTANG